MRQKTALTRGRALSVLVAALIGYLIGGWHPAVLDAKTDMSAAQSVAQRFPQQWDMPPRTIAVPAPPLPAAGVLKVATTSSEVAAAQFTLLDPTPMVPSTAPQGATPVAQAPAVEAAAASTAPEVASLAPAVSVYQARPPMPRPAGAQSVRQAKASKPDMPHPAANRPGYILDDAQIASIKARLHLTPDQERMWPAVEAALRNMAYQRMQEARRRDGASRDAQVAFDPDAVAGLKSAAVPLIMSFNDEQKQEVRDLAHVMGLDQLAAQF